jgi:hypothetical protein
MTAAAIIADVRRSIEILVDADDPAATRVGLALEAWLRGTDLEASLGLMPGWRQYVRQKARAAALDGLLRMHPGVKDSALADLIIDGIERVDCTGIRPDGVSGYFQDLKRAGCTIGNRQWRRDIAEAHRVGHQGDGMSKPIESPFATKLEV